MPVNLDRVKVDKLTAEKKWLEERIEALSRNRKQSHETTAKQIAEREDELAVVDAAIVAEYEHASPGKLAWTPDALDQLLGLYDRMCVEQDQQERIKMREELVELVTIKFIDLLVLYRDDLRVAVHFKTRKNGQSLVHHQYRSPRG